MKLTEAIRAGLKKGVVHTNEGYTGDTERTEEGKVTRACAFGLAYLGYHRLSKKTEHLSFFNIRHELQRKFNLTDTEMLDVVEWNDDYKLPITEILNKLEERGK